MLQNSAPFSSNVCPKSRQQCNILLENFNKCHIPSHKTRYPHNKLGPQSQLSFTPQLSICTSLSYHECLSGCWWWGPGHWAQEEVSVYGRSHSFWVSGVRTRSDHHPSLILIPGCRVCCVLILLLPPSLRRVVPRVSEPFTGTITMSPGSRHQHNTSGTLTLEPAGP